MVIKNIANFQIMVDGETICYYNTGGWLAHPYYFGLCKQLIYQKKHKTDDQVHQAS